MFVLYYVYFNNGLAWSGYGMVRNIAGGNVTMPEIYTRTLASVDRSDWVYSSWVPDAVVINLGTNDQLQAQPSIETEYIDTYVNFVRQLYVWYGEPFVFLACGPMSEAYCDAVLTVIKDLEAVSSEYNIYFLDQRNVLNSTNQCCGHPDIDADVTLAELTTQYIRDILGW